MLIKYKIALWYYCDGKKITALLVETIKYSSRKKTGGIFNPSKKLLAPTILS